MTLGGDRPVKGSPRGVVTYMSTSLPKDLKNLMNSLEHLAFSFLRTHAYPVSRSQPNSTSGDIAEIAEIAGIAGIGEWLPGAFLPRP